MRGSAFGRILYKGDKAVDFIVHADQVFAAFAQDLEIIGVAAVDHDFFNLVRVAQDHSGDRLEDIFETSGAFDYIFNVIVQGRFTG